MRLGRLAVVVLDPVAGPGESGQQPILKRWGRAPPPWGAWLAQERERQARPSSSPGIRGLARAGRRLTGHRPQRVRPYSQRGRVAIIALVELISPPAPLDQ